MSYNIADRAHDPGAALQRRDGLRQAGKLNRRLDGENGGHEHGRETWVLVNVEVR